MKKDGSLKLASVHIFMHSGFEIRCLSCLIPVLTGREQGHPSTAGVRFLHEGKTLSFARPSYSHF